MAHEQSFQDSLAEIGVGSAVQEPVELHQQPQVDVLALGLLAPDFLVLVVADVHSLPREEAETSLRAPDPGWRGVGQAFSECLERGSDKARSRRAGSGPPGPQGRSGDGSLRISPSNEGPRGGVPFSP